MKSQAGYHVSSRSQPTQCKRVDCVDLHWPIWEETRPKATVEQGLTKYNTKLGFTSRDVVKAQNIKNTRENLHLSWDFRIEFPLNF